MGIQQLPPKHCFDLREADPAIVHIDVRTPEEFALGHPAGALNIPLGEPEFLRVVKAMAPQDKRVILSCGMGGRSQRACVVLQAEGYPWLVNMVGGFAGLRERDGTLVEQGWKDVGLPCQHDVEERGWDTLASRV